MYEPARLTHRRAAEAAARRGTTLAPRRMLSALGLRVPGVFLRASCVLLSVPLWNCTLTQDDFQPVLTEADTVQPAPEPAHEAEPPSAAACTASLECPAGFECIGDVCLPSGCDAAEDVAACVVDVCVGDDCAPGCSDGAQGDGETGVDCGGPCAPCSAPTGSSETDRADAGCASDSECAPGACVEGSCREPSCDDGLTNQDETGPDCGGATCARCAVGAACQADSDCEEARFCASMTSACSPVSCQDGNQNGAEHGVDCGGGECPGCEVGAPCEAAVDCVSSSCVEGACAEPSCDDAVRNGDESDVDCGGNCPRCGTGLGCVAPADCTSAVCDDDCAAGIEQCCQAPSCDDGVRNGSETAIDCGAAPCGRCGVGAPCTQGGQCASNVCAGNVCSELCDDGVRNGNEGAADCGGTEAGCPRCDDGQPCGVDADCASGACDAGACVSCTDGLENGDEGGVDCGGSQPGCPACPRCTVDNSVDLGFAGTIVGVNANGCARITLFPTYPPTRFDSFDVGPFPVPFSWVQDCSQQSGSGVFQTPYQTLPLSGLSIDCPVIFEFDGSAEPINVRWF
jgi:hypothetical protein